MSRNAQPPVLASSFSAELVKLLKVTESDLRESKASICRFMEELTLPAEDYPGFYELFAHSKYQITFSSGKVKLYIGDQNWQSCSASKIKELKTAIPTLKSLVLQHFRNLNNANN